MLQQDEVQLSLKVNKVSWILALELAGLIIAGTFFLPGGSDLHNFYLPFAEGCLNCGFAPYFTQWVLAPLAWLPPGLAWPALTTFTIGVLLLVSRYFTGTNPLWLLLAFSTLSVLWLGQIDALIIVGLTLMVFGPNAWLRGAGLSLAIIKPQIAGLGVIVLLLHEKPCDLMKIAAAPVVVLLLSLWSFGLDWPLRWLGNAAQVPAHAHNLDVVDPLPYLLIPVLWFYRGRENKFKAALWISTMASPYFGLYSYVVPLTFGLQWWAVLLSYIWLLAYSLGNSFLRLAWVFPLTMLLYQYLKQQREVKARTNPDCCKAA